MSFAVVTMLNVGICTGKFNLIINAFFLKQNFEMGFDDVITEFQNSRQGCTYPGHLVAQPTEFCIVVSDILSIIIVLFLSLGTEMFISSYAHGTRAI